jgi:methylated-DNA-[protein]-cysteine S-methyltransferase
MGFVHRVLGLENRADSVKALGGFKGDAQDAPSGINQKEKLELLRSEGVLFDGKGYLVERERWWDDFKP